jgi:hypothetical protein
MNFKQVGAFSFAAILILILIMLSFRLREKEEDKWINLSFLVLGISVGWLFGIYIAPYEGEVTKFKEIATTVSVFLSGYLLAKVDGLITKILSPEQVLRPVAGFRVLATFCSFLLSLIMTYVGRAYM